MAELEQVLEFDIVFPDEDYHSYLSYVNRISRSVLIKLSTLLLRFGPAQNSKIEHAELFKMWFGPDDEQFARACMKNIRLYEEKVGYRTVIINPISSLNFFEAVLNTEQTHVNLPDNKINELFFKIYLAFNQQATSTYQISKQSTDQLIGEDQMTGLLLCQSIPESDILNHNLPQCFYTQFLKSLYLLKFLSSIPAFELLLRRFFLDLNVKDYREYLRQLIPIVISVFSSTKEGAIDIVVNEADPSGPLHNFLDHWDISSDFIAEPDRDFVKLRSTPLIKLDLNVYRVIFPLFVVESLYKSQYFRLKIVNDQLGENKIKDLRNFLTFEFSEKQLLYVTIEKSFGKRYKQFNGQQIADSGIAGGPDFYIRNGNQVLIFESKDVLLNADVKMSYDYAKIEAELKKKFYLSFDKRGNLENRAVLQLISFIKKLLDDNFPIDNGFKPKNVNVYPIIVIHDRQLEVFGINKLINKWFQAEVAAMKALGYFTDNIRNPIIITIDTLLIYKDLIYNKVIRIEQVIDEYHIFCNKKANSRKVLSDAESKNTYLDRFMPFDAYLFKFYRTKYPNDFFNEGLDLFDET